MGVAPRSDRARSWPLVLILVGSLGLASCTGPEAPPAEAPSPPAWVTAYYAGWFWHGYQPQHVKMENLTHLVFGRVAPGPMVLDAGTPVEKTYAAGEVVYMAGTAGMAGQLGDVSPLSVEDYLVQKAHQSGKKALLMIGGVGDGRGFDESTRPAVIDTFIDNLLDYLEDHQYDGIDVDWEDFLVEPVVEGKNTEEDNTRRVEQLLSLVSKLKAQALLRARWATAGLLITFPGYAVNINYEKPWVHPWQVELASMIDQYNLMSYGLAYAAPGWSSWHFSAVGGAGPTHPYDLKTSIQAYVDAGIPRSKMGIGIGFYGHSYLPGYTGPGQMLPQGAPWNTIYNSDSDWNWANLKNRGYLDHGTYVWHEEAMMGSRWYGEANGHPTGYAGEWGVASGWLSYEDENSLAAKGKWVRDSGIGGTIVWVLNYGSADGTTNPLMDALGEAFLR